MVANPKCKISVIIPVFNAGKYLRECLDSVVTQSLKDIEIVCINDGSTDNSPEILREYAAKDKRIVVISKKNAGVGAARNDGIAAAQGKYVIFPDPDDYFPSSDVLEVLYKEAVRHKVKICGGEFAMFSDENPALHQHFDESDYGYLFAKTKVISYKDWQFDYGFHRFIYDRKFLIENKIYYPHYKRFQDPPFFVKAMITAGEFCGVHKICYAYRCGNKVKWTTEKIHDLLCGLNDNFAYAEQYGLEKLKKQTITRLRQHWGRICNNLDFGAYQVLRKMYLKCPAVGDIVGEPLTIGNILRKLWRKKKMKNDNIEKHSRTVKLFFFLPIYGWKQRGGKKVWKILGLPVFKVRKMANGITTKYYILGLPVMKVSKKYV